MKKMLTAFLFLSVLLNVALIVSGLRNIRAPLAVEAKADGDERVYMVYAKARPACYVMLHMRSNEIFKVSVKNNSMWARFNEGANIDARWATWEVDVLSGTNVLNFVYSGSSGYPFVTYGDQESRVLVDDKYYRKQSDGQGGYIMINDDKVRIQLKDDKSGYEETGAEPKKRKRVTH